MPIVAGPEELRKPDDPSKASGDRLQIPGASTSGDWSREVLQYDVPSQENPGQASGDRLIAFLRCRGTGRPVAQGSTAASKFLKKASPVNIPTHRHNVVAEQHEVKPKRETPDDKSSEEE